MLENTCTATMPAPVATPPGGVADPPGGFGPLPGGMPATWRPWLHDPDGPDDHVHGKPAPVPVACDAEPCDVLVPGHGECEKQASNATLPVRNGWLDSTPVST